MMIGGTAANIYGTRQRDKAQRAAMAKYQAAVNAKAVADQKAMRQESGVLSGFVGERQRGISGYLRGLASAGREDPNEAAQFRQGQRGALTDIGKLTGGPQSQYAYSGTPRGAAEGMQAQQTEADNTRLAEAMLADHQLRQIQGRQTDAAHQMTFADLMRQSRGTSTKQRFELAKALRDLDWQKKQAALQGQLDDAGRKGQWANILGGLGTQAGGMMMMSSMAGAGGGGGAAGGMGGAATSSAGIPGTVMETSSSLSGPWNIG
jgi:hypothetical protein